jgi:hypothetical protein
MEYLLPVVYSIASTNAVVGGYFLQNAEAKTYCRLVIERLSWLLEFWSFLNEKCQT